MVTTSHWQRGGGPDRSYDAVILGGGIVGCATAYWISKLAPTTRIAVVEARRVAAGASGRNAGFLICGTADSYVSMIEQYGRETARFVWETTRESVGLTREFVDGTNADCDLVPNGSLVAAGDEEEAAELRASAPLLAEDGFKVEYSDEDPLGRGFRAGLFNATDCGVNPVKLVRALAAASGADLLEGTAAHAVESSGARRAVVCDRGRVEAERVVVALNAYAPLVLPEFADLVSPVRGQVLVTEPLPDRILGPMVYANRGFEYFRQLPDNRLLMGGWRKRFVDAEVGYAENTTEGVQKGLEDYTRSLFPEAAGARIEARWGGTMGFTANHLPLFGAAAGDDAVVYGVGFSGHGMSLGMWAGRHLARAAVAGRAPAPFGPAAASASPAD